jgi:hypothetical protein|tara:strand:+ start:1286 stop:1471 length:186 start_codon:yes stop_codon:yes gene_type:complete
MAANWLEPEYFSQGGKSVVILSNHYTPSLIDYCGVIVITVSLPKNYPMDFFCCLSEVMQQL